MRKKQNNWHHSAGVVLVRTEQYKLWLRVDYEPQSLRVNTHVGAAAQCDRGKLVADARHQSELAIPISGSNQAEFAQFRSLAA